MIVSETERLIIRHFQLSDADYMLRQLNEDSFIRFIADRQIRDLKGTEDYLANGPMLSYQKHGFGLNAVVLKAENKPIGMCGLVKRDELAFPDLGYALLPEYWRQGYTYEACVGVLEVAKELQHSDRIMGVTLPDNQASNGLLRRLGFSQVGELDLYGHNNNLYELWLGPVRTNLTAPVAPKTRQSRREERSLAC